MLAQIVFFSSALTLMIVSGLLLYSLVQFRRRSAPTVDPRFRDHPLLESVWAIVPVLILLILLWLTYWQL